MSDVYNILTNHVLREQYDKHNQYYSEDDFVKKMAKNIPSYTKLGLQFRAITGLAPNLGIIYMVMGETALVGRKMSIILFSALVMLIFELKKPADGMNENRAVKFFE